MRGSRVAESPVFCRRPLEPDAGNAAEGSEGPVPDWRFSHAFSRRTADYTDEYGSNGRCHLESRMLSGRGTSHKHETFSAPMSILPKNDIAAGIDDPKKPVIPNEVEGSRRVT